MSRSESERGVLIEVLLFAGLAEAHGAPRLELEVDPSIDIEAFLRRVGEAAPALGPLLSHSRVAVDHEFRSSGPLLPAREIALIPPVSGG